MSLNYKAILVGALTSAIGILAADYARDRFLKK